VRQQFLPTLQPEDHVKRAIRLLQEHEPPEGYYGAFSGGKDSCTIKALAKMAGVKVRWHYNHTTIDAPELVRFIKSEHSDVEWNEPSGYIEDPKRAWAASIARWRPMRSVRRSESAGRRLPRLGSAR